MLYSIDTWPHRLANTEAFVCPKHNHFHFPMDVFMLSISYLLFPRVDDELLVGPGTG